MTGLQLRIFLLISFNWMILCSLYKHDDQLETIVHGNNKFTLKILKFLGSNYQENLFFSPASVYLAMGAVFLGARKESAAQLADVFNWNSLDRSSVYQSLKILRKNVINHREKQIELKLANRIWGHRDLHLEEMFLNVLREYYETEIALRDFGRDSEGVRNEVNEWVKEQTNGKIKDFLPPGIITANTQLAIVNAIYFKGLWKYKFKEQNTFSEPFYAFGSQEKEEVVEMMTMKSKFNFLYDERHGCRMLELPYSGNEVSMLLLLPEEMDGLAKLEQSFTVENLKRWTSMFSNTTVSVSLPKFKLYHQIDLKRVLTKLGIHDIFDSGKANFSGLSQTDGVFVSNAIHKAFVDVNEAGTEATAATGVVMMRRSVDMFEIFHVDHPFIFLIRHLPSNSILFAGRVLEIGSKTGPSKANGRQDDEL